MSIFTISGIGIVTAVAVTAAKEHSRATGLAIALCGGGLMLFFCLSPIKQISSELDSLFSKAQIDRSWLGLLLKSTGICIAAEFASDACKDFGLEGLSGRIQLFGKAAIVILSLPLLTELLDTIIQLL